MPDEQYDVFIDSDAFIALLITSDDQHLKSVEGFAKIKQERLTAITSDLVISEASSVLSRRFDLRYAKQFLESVQDLMYVTFDPQDRQDTIQLFSSQSKQNTSFVDMSNIVLMRRYLIPKIFSFDRVYMHDFDLSPLVNMTA